MITLSVETLVSLGTVVAAFTGLAVFVRATYRELRADLKADIAELRTELRDGLAGAERATTELRTELREGLADAARATVELRTELRDGLARVEQRVDVLDDRVYMLAVGLRPLIEARDGTATPGGV